LQNCAGRQLATGFIQQLKLLLQALVGIGDLQQRLLRLEGIHLDLFQRK
jgi:hypothetical protein